MYSAAIVVPFWKKEETTQKKKKQISEFIRVVKQTGSNNRYGTSGKWTVNHFFYIIAIKDQTGEFFTHYATEEKESNIFNKKDIQKVLVHCSEYNEMFSNV